MAEAVRHRDGDRNIVMSETACLPAPCRLIMVFRFFIKMIVRRGAQFADRIDENFAVPPCRALAAARTFAVQQVHSSRQRAAIS